MLKTIIIKVIANIVAFVITLLLFWLFIVIYAIFTDRKNNQQP